MLLILQGLRLVLKLAALEELLNLALARTDQITMKAAVPALNAHSSQNATSGNLGTLLQQ
jgi:hypothetical protein